MGEACRAQPSLYWYHTCTSVVLITVDVVPLTGSVWTFLFPSLYLITGPIPPVWYHDGSTPVLAYWHSWCHIGLITLRSCLPSPPKMQLQGILNINLHHCSATANCSECIVRFVFPFSTMIMIMMIVSHKSFIGFILYFYLKEYSTTSCTSLFGKWWFVLSANQNTGTITTHPEASSCLLSQCNVCWPRSASKLFYLLYFQLLRL